ncbi:DUF2071 domain-containing protein [Nocardiopsis mangrovi]|uniref:DUF2071 domain-containing protein n=1 Tax=Nocardiopsis mangrovi TaxID=1179818 RepID=A0ABV9DV57_9ACTN
MPGAARSSLVRGVVAVDPGTTHTRARGTPGRRRTHHLAGVAFLHWRVAPDAVSALLPAGTRADTLDGVAYAGLVAFRVPESPAFGAVPTGAFTEANVRLCSVDGRGRRGVVFVSMDADSAPVVARFRRFTGCCEPPHRRRRRDRPVEQNRAASSDAAPRHAGSCAAIRRRGIGAPSTAWPRPDHRGRACGAVRPCARARRSRRRRRRRVGKVGRIGGPLFVRGSNRRAPAPGADKPSSGQPIPGVSSR